MSETPNTPAAGGMAAVKAPPPISAGLRQKLEKTVGETENYIRVMLRVINQEVPAYGAITDPELAGEVRQMTRINLEIWNRVLLEQRIPSDDDLAPVASFARRRYHQGIALTDLLHSFRVGASAVWREILDQIATEPRIQAELLLHISPYLLEHVDLLGQVLSHNYLDEAHRSRRWRDRRYQDLCSLILSRPDDHERFQVLTNELQIDPDGRRAALLLETIEPIDISVPGGSPEDLLQKAMDCLQLDHEPLNTDYHGRLLLWLPLAVGESPVIREQSLMTASNHLIASAPEALKSIGLGLSRSGAKGWRTSAEQAMSALDWGRRNTKAEAGAVYSYSTVVLEDAVTSPRFDGRYFEDLLALLSDDVALIQTLRVWLDTPGLTRKVAAAALSIHPNTLDYRLRKVEQRLGADLADLSWLARLHVAFRLHGKG